MNRKGVDGTGELLRKRRVHQAVALDPGFSREALGNQSHPEVRFAPWPGAGMTRVKVRLVDDSKAVRVERPGEFFLNSLLDQHDAAILFRDNVAP